MNTKKISTWIFYCIAGVVFIIAISTSISSFKSLSSSDKINEIINEINTGSNTTETDSELYESIDSSNATNNDTIVYELIEDDDHNITAYSIDVVNFKILLNDSRIGNDELEEIYDEIKIHLAGKLQKNQIFYIDESSIEVSDNEVLFKLIDSSTKKEFETLKIKYK